MHFGQNDNNNWGPWMQLTQFSLCALLLCSTVQAEEPTFQELLDAQITANDSIPKGVSVLVENYPQAARSILHEAFTSYPQQIPAIVQAVVNQQPALSALAVEEALKLPGVNVGKVVAAAIEADPACSDVVVTSAIQDEPARLKEIVGIALSTEPLAVDSIVQSAAQQQPGRLSEIMALVKKYVPEQLEAAWLAIKAIFPDAKDDNKEKETAKAADKKQ